MKNTMSLKYKLIKQTNSESKYYNQVYARAVHQETIDLEKVAELVQRNCSMKKSDCYAVMKEFVEVLTDQLQAGAIVNVNGLGRFSMGIKSSYAKTVDEFSASTNISGYRVNFLPEYTVEKTGTYYDEETGTYKIRRVHNSPLTNGVTVEEIPEYSTK